MDHFQIIPSNLTLRNMQMTNSMIVNKSFKEFVYWSRFKPGSYFEQYRYRCQSQYILRCLEAVRQSSPQFGMQFRLSGHQGITNHRDQSGTGSKRSRWFALLMYQILCLQINHRSTLKGQRFGLGMIFYHRLSDMECLIDLPRLEFHPARQPSQYRLKINPH